MRHRSISIAAVVSLVVALGCSCASAGPPPAEADYGVHIATNTPQGLRAKQTMDMVNSEWAIGHENTSTLASPDNVDSVIGAMDRLWRDRPITITGIDVGAGTATLHVTTSYGADQNIELRTNEAGLVDHFDVTPQPPSIKTWSDVDDVLTKSGARYSYAASKVSDGRCTTVAGTNVDEPLPLASVFKLYVLLALADAVNHGTVAWSDQLTITAEDKAVGSAGFDALKPGSRVSVRDAAQQMISASDNMATDMIIDRLGQGAVEHALVLAGHHDPASMTPFPTAHELFSIGWGNPDVREQWKNASPSVRADLLAQTKTRPYQPDPARTHTPASPYGIEWYGTAGDICRVHAALQKAAVGPAAPVRGILSAVSGIDLDTSKWNYIGAKGGNVPGDLIFSWYAEDRSGQGWVVSFQLTWPAYRSLAAAEWLLSIAKQSFAMLPVGPPRP